MFCSLAAARVCRSQAQYTAEDEEHYGQHHHDVCECEIFEHFCSAISPYSSRFATAKEEMIGEWLNENTITGIASHRVIHRPFPVADAVSRDSVSSAAPFHCGIRVQSQQHQYANKREYQNTHRFNDHLLTEANDGHHTHDQDQRQNRTRRWRHTQLVRHEAFNGIGDCHAINQQDRVDSEEVEQGNQFTCANTKVFFYNLGDVFARVFYQTVRSESGRGEQKTSSGTQG